MSALTELASPDGLAGQLMGSLGDLAAPFLQGADKLQILKQPQGPVTELAQSLNQLDVSDLGINASFATHLDSLGDLLPHDLSSLTGTLESGITDLTGRLNSDVARVIQGLMTTLSAITAIMDMDFTCSGTSVPQEPGPGPGTSGSSGGSSGGPAGAGNSSAHVNVVAQGAEQMEHLEAMLDLLPDPFNVGALLELLGKAGDIRAASALIPGNIPFFDDILDTASTLLHWKNASPAELLDHLQASVTQVDTFIKNAVQAQIAALSTDIAHVLPQIDPAALRDASETIAEELRAAASSVSAGDWSSIDVSTLNSALDSFSSLTTSMPQETITRIETLCATVCDLPHRIEDEMTHLLSLLRPNIPVGELSGLFTSTGLLHPEMATGPESPVAQEITEAFQPLKQWLQALADILDPHAITEPLQQVSSEIQGAVSKLEQDLAGVTANIRSLFSDFEEQLDRIDIAAIREEITGAIHELGTRIEDLIKSITVPLEEAVEQAVGAIEEELDKFSPAQLEQAVGDALTNITDVLNTVEEPLSDVKKGLEDISKAIEGLSFTPITDQVIQGIDSIADALHSIDASKLNDLLKEAIETALKILPDSLEPVTDPLIDELGELIEQGPVPILEKAGKEPKRIFNAIRGFSPSELVGDTLDGPYSSLLKEMEDFRPTSLLDPLQQELDGISKRLRETALPSKALKQLSGPWDQINRCIEDLKPSNLVEPLNRLIQDGLKEITDLIPTDEIFSVFDRILEPLQELSDLNQKVTSLSSRIDAIGTALENPEPEIEAWLNSILDKIPSLPDTAPLDQKLSELNTTIEGLSCTAIREAIETATAEMRNMLTALEPGTCLSAIAKAYADFPRHALETPPDSSEKQALQSALDRFDPMDPQWNRLLRILSQCQQSLQSTLSWFDEYAQEWNSRYLGQDSPLSELAQHEISTSTLRQWIQEELEDSFLRLFNVLLQYLSTYIRPAAMVLKEIASLSQPITSRLDALATGPASLQAIREAVDNLLSAVRNLNLDFLTDAVDQVFDEVKSKLAILNPDTLSQPLDAEFNNLVENLSIENILKPEDMDLDDAYNSLLEKLKSLSPSKLLEDTVEPLYRDSVLPLIDQLDFTPVLDAITERLRSLDDELKEEMERVNQSYAVLKHAVPAGISMGSAAA